MDRLQLYPKKPLLNLICKLKNELSLKCKLMNEPWPSMTRLNVEWIGFVYDVEWKHAEMLAVTTYIYICGLRNILENHCTRGQRVTTMAKDDPTHAHMCVWLVEHRSSEKQWLENSMRKIKIIGSIGLRMVAM